MQENRVLHSGFDEIGAKIFCLLDPKFGRTFPSDTETGLVSRPCPWDHHIVSLDENEVSIRASAELGVSSVTEEHLVCIGGLSANVYF